MDRLFIETKILGTDDGTISGLAWKFGSPDRIGDWIDPGAFKGAKLPIPMLFGHDMNDPVGTWDIAEEKADGLHLTGKLLVDARLYRWPLQPHHIEIIRAMDDAWLAHTYRQKDDATTKAAQIKHAQPLTPEAFDAVFG